MILTTFLTNLSVFLFLVYFIRYFVFVYFFFIACIVYFLCTKQKGQVRHAWNFYHYYFFSSFLWKKKSFFLFYYFIHLYFRTDFFDLRRLWKRQENYIDNNKHETNYLTRVPISQFFLTNNGREYTFPFLHSFGKTKKH